MAIVTIIGSGMMGSALVFPAFDNGHEVRLVGSPLDDEIIDVSIRTGRHPKFDVDFPDGVKYYHVTEMEEAIKGADLVIGGVSSFGVDWFGADVLPKIPDGVPVLSVTKGLMDTEDGRLLTYPELWTRRLEAKGLRKTICAVGGPCISFELTAREHTEVAFCGTDLDVLRKVRSIMETPYYHISITTDVTGIETAVALKNGYALGISLSIGLNKKKYGDDRAKYNAQAGLFYQAVREMGLILKYQGAGELENLAMGAGDLYVTVFGGRTRRVGILLGEGYDIDEAREILNGVTLESLVVAQRVAKAIRKAAKYGRVSLKDFPLLLHMDRIIREKASPELPWDEFRYVK